MRVPSLVWMRSWNVCCKSWLKAGAIKSSWWAAVVWMAFFGNKWSVVTVINRTNRVSMILLSSSLSLAMQWDWMARFVYQLTLWYFWNVGKTVGSLKPVLKHCLRSARIFWVLSTIWINGIFVNWLNLIIFVWLIRRLLVIWLTLWR